ncbi:uncharacterized protein G6M90_00g031080 [Metarhizium brunneum]|uniref:Uncharacterized protein n=1 Tax=Metarhizium brunneum TaxID=500148 RepID=A0A7D5YT22_9HYPO|nr:hypothetical protein G6M90_00g031080 [Metarhizium brunneum]
MKYFILLLAACGSLAAALKYPSVGDIILHARVCEKAENIDVKQCKRAFVKYVRQFVADHQHRSVSDEIFWNTMKQWSLLRTPVNYALYCDDGDKKFKCEPSELNTNKLDCQSVSTRAGQNCPDEDCLPFSNLTSFCDEKGGCETCRDAGTVKNSRSIAYKQEPANSATLKKRFGGALLNFSCTLKQGDGSGNMTRAQ